ncbi:hypothetical protein K470DRAFT_281078 [Piedraia hortae CBS 480.64]|uniref:Zn(2)-C6 fungal-type domain-containing protein n=1 Tax=Piedraia hortae CBS 480.64 TaxID=1314780 RepID=A0A6A7C4P8_9PEZI|nr:hypothetical protein K470DRAFT_281078 [Piedraia hortae CBS 480.64]
MDTPTRFGMGENPPLELRKAKNERDKRTYRACLHCRQRKSRCDLSVTFWLLKSSANVSRYSSGEPGRPPCERCIREQHECILGGSRRGGKRIKRSEASQKAGPVATSSPAQQFQSAPPTQVSVASTDLQNPADALAFPADVAERNADNHSITASPDQTTSSKLHRKPLDSNVVDFLPLTRGLISLEMMQQLLSRYGEKYHKFFPLANPSIFEWSNLPVYAIEEPHLLTAILTVASKDESSWFESLISELLEAVEAMLILAEWVPRQAHKNAASVGRGEEDQAAWMYVGIAIRLGYLLGIDRSGFRDEEMATADLDRKRLAWAACYMNDRQISVRIGKAFWSRGPGPMTALQAQDFPGLRPRPGCDDDLAAVFQANLELTQLFSNAHDVLYATKSRANQLNEGGEYVKYIDDFCVALRSWHRIWKNFRCSPPIRASLLLSYEYLRLYVNAFAYQATLNRLSSQKAVGDNASRFPAPYPFADVAATPDARFIYDSIDAARSLLEMFTTQVDPLKTFRYMPLRFYLYVIYSACFLFKARATGVMGEDDTVVKTLITETANALHLASACPNDIGDRYSRLICLLWQKASSDVSTVSTNVQREMESRTTADMGINSFSWLDLPAMGEFATQTTDDGVEKLIQHENSQFSCAKFSIHSNPSQTNHASSFAKTGLPPGLFLIGT